MNEIRSAGSRFVTEQPGITSWHCFSAGAHYDPGNVAFGPIVGVDEHLVQPGAGFDWHAHRDVHIVSWVLEGVLRHEDGNGDQRFVAPGVLLVQSTGGGVRHRETNPSDSEPLRFVQITLIGSSEPAARVEAPPATVGDCVIWVCDSEASLGGRTNDFVLVTRGEFLNEEDDLMETGSSMRVYDGDYAFPGGEGELLIVTR